ncbi:MAG: TAXI family TRAP transporter solute-binding subunit [Pseudomonadota bacterium]
MSVFWINGFLWLCALSGDARAFDLDAQRALVNKGVIGVLGNGARGTDFALIADLAIALDKGYDRRILPMAGAGSVRAIEDLLLLRGVDVAFVQADVLDYYKRTDLFPDIDDKLAYLARLYSKEFHLLASKDIGSIQDLEGQKVNFGPPSSGSFLTASLVFDALGIQVEARDDDYQIALDKLRQGEIAAWVRVDAKPSLQMADLPSWEELHLIPLPTAAIEEPYVAAELTSEDYPGLIDGEASITTLAVPTIMAAYAWPRRHQKRAQLESFQDALIDRLGQLRQTPFHAKWQEVDPKAEIAGWQRF